MCFWRNVVKPPGETDSPYVIVWKDNIFFKSWRVYPIRVAIIKSSGFLAGLTAISQTKAIMEAC